MTWGEEEDHGGGSEGMDVVPYKYRPEDSALKERHAEANLNPQNPADIGWPATLPVELAMRVAPKEEILEAYGIGQERWDQLRIDPLFINAIKAAVDMLKEDGASFKIKAKMQAEELLKTSWTIVHDVAAPYAVRASLIRDTVRWAGYDNKNAEAGSAVGNFNIQINLG
jgi:hypothetical protein